MYGSNVIDFYDVYVFYRGDDGYDPNDESGVRIHVNFKK